MSDMSIFYPTFRITNEMIKPGRGSVHGALALERFLDWLAPPGGLRWLDVGCGNGAFTELIVERCAPAEVQGIDPSQGQLAFARERPAARVAEFRQGDAVGLPFAEGRFELAVMALVIFFDDFWTTNLMGASIGPTIAAMASSDVELHKTRLRARLPPDGAGRITYGARANAVNGRVPR